MKAFALLVAVAALAAAGCQSTVELPKGTRIIFESNEAANAFRGAVLVDVTNLGNVVKVDKPLAVVVP